MSQPRFEELVDLLAATLLRVDFGSAPSLLETQQRVAAVLELLEQTDRQDLVLAATPFLEMLRRCMTRSRVTKHDKKALADQLEQLVQSWYTAAKDWEASEHRGHFAQGLQKSELVDSALLAEFFANTQLRLDELQLLIDEIELGSVDALASLRRIVHTVKGEAGMLGLDAISRILHAAESYTEVPAPCWTRAATLQMVHLWLRDALDLYSRGKLPLVPSELLATLEQAAAQADCSPPAAAPAPCTQVTFDSTLPPLANELSAQAPHWEEQDLELVSEFLHEGTESTALIDQTLLEIESQGPDEERINRLFRVFHSLKGVASFLHLEQVVELTHTTETMLDMVRTGKLSAELGVIDLVFDATAMLRRLLGVVQCASNGRTPLEQVDGVGELVSRLERAIFGQVPSGSVLAATPNDKLGKILVENGAVSDSQLDRALQQQKETGRRLGEELVLAGAVPAKVVAQALRAQAPSGQQTKTRELLKVDLERVDNLVETIGELVIVESMVSNAPEIRTLPIGLRNHLGQFAKITRELQELGMRMRMVPLRAEFQKMARMVRDLTRRSNKRVRVELRGEQTEMDRSMVEQIADPLVHLIRNAVDHGVESPEERAQCGKPDCATIVLSASHEGGSIVVEISDDGCGIDRERVIAKAIERGLIADGTALSDTQVYELLFLPGFSTAAQVTEISGRGVGMDVVKRNIEALRGRIITQSQRGRGTSFRLVLPLTLAIIDGMVIRSGTERYIVPTLNIVESLQPTPGMLFSIAGQNEHVMVRGCSLPLVRLGDVLGVDDQERDPTKALVLIVESMRGRIALLVDEVIMKHQVVIKTLSPEVMSSNLFAGAAILSNGHVGLILNVEALTESVLTRSGRHSVAVA